MKKLLTVALAIGSFAVFAQENVENPNERIGKNELGQTVITCTPTDFMVTPPVSEWPGVTEEKLREFQERVHTRQFNVPGYDEAVQMKENDGALQTAPATHQSRSPIVNWTAQSGGIPPDPSGAAGPDHYVQAVNTTWRIYDKNGGGASLIMSLSSLWPGSSNEGDPIVMYDRHADRWFISQFQFSPNRILVAISETGDPTGSYYAYSFTLSQFPDYPKYSIWWDGYYMTSNSTHTAVVFERDAMIAGDPNAQMVSLSLPSLGNGGFRSPLPADADGVLPPNGTPCYFFNLEDNAFAGVSQDQIEIYEMTTDWNNTNNSQVVSSQQLPVASFDAVFSGGFANIAQPGTNQRIDAIQGVLMYRAQHMRWTGYNSIVLSHAVDLGGNSSGVRWYELRDNDNGVWSVHQQATYSPDNVDRWMSSAAMDIEGNIGMAYSVCDASANIYPGIRYTGRLATDPLNQMTMTEEVAVDGLASQTIADRYGDYAQLSLDPDGSTFWYTGEWLGSNASRRTQIFSFSLAQNASVSNPYYEELEMTVATSKEAITVSLDGIYGNEEVSIDIMGMDGRIISSQKGNPVDGFVSHIFSAASLKSGVYFVRVGNKNFQEAKRIVYTK